jgi:hypothetical protein
MNIAVIFKGLCPFDYIKVYDSGKGKGNVHPRTGHEGPEGE